VDVPNHPVIPIPSITVEDYDKAEERTRKSQSLRVMGRSQSLLDLRKAEKNVYKKTRQMSVSLTGTIEDNFPMYMLTYQQERNSITERVLTAWKTLTYGMLDKQAYKESKSLRQGTWKYLKLM
jgi:hypothetical protein